jgi:hypothetical protein
MSRGNVRDTHRRHFPIQYRMSIESVSVIAHSMESTDRYPIRFAIS